MKYKNPIPKSEREKIKRLFQLEQALIKKGVITDDDIKKEKI